MEDVLNMTRLRVTLLPLLVAAAACFADTETKTESRMFDLVYARAEEVADGLNRAERIGDQVNLDLLRVRV